jgi:hypothetical protein
VALTVKVTEATIPVVSKSRWTNFFLAGHSMRFQLDNAADLVSACKVGVLCHLASSAAGAK